MMEGGGTRGRTNQKLFGNGEVNAPRSHPYNIIKVGDAILPPVVLLSDY